MRVHLYVHRQQLQIISSLLFCIVFSGLLNVKIIGANAIGEANAVAAAAADAPNRRPFLDVYLRVEPVDDFCGALRCNISYAILLTNMQNKFDLHSLMLQDGHMPRRSQENGQPPVGGFFFEDNTVVRLSDELRTKRGKIYLGLMLFDLPDDIQDYLVVEVTNVIRTGRRVKTEFSSDTVRIGVQVYRRNEAASSTLDQSASIGDLQTQQRPSSSSSSSSASITRARALVSNGKNVEKRHHNQQEEEEEEEQGQMKRPLIEQGQGQKNVLSSSADAAEADSFSAVVIGTDDSGKMPMTEKQETAPKCATNVAARSCACCEHVTVRKIRLDDEVCVNVTYLPTKIGVRLAVSVDGHVYYSKDLAVFNPESACFEVPEMREYASICINLYNMELKNNKLTGCAKLEAILLHLRVAQHKIGCFSIPI
ncbi:hypothetical protein niasHS_014339 [Heterodera schachtii]|uniref:DUF4773 domain-containing protein n=1 Tax=Heterodera schachtii TaxID=97005 RepID=A0ABD2I316_HETSC